MLIHTGYEDLELIGNRLSITDQYEYRTTIIFLNDEEVAEARELFKLYYEADRLDEDIKWQYIEDLHLIVVVNEERKDKVESEW